MQQCAIGYGCFVAVTLEVDRRGARDDHVGMCQWERSGHAAWLAQKWGRRRWGCRVHGGVGWRTRHGREHILRRTGVREARSLSDELARDGSLSLGRLASRHVHRCATAQRDGCSRNDERMRKPIHRTELWCRRVWTAGICGRDEGDLAAVPLALLNATKYRCARFGILLETAWLSASVCAYAVYRGEGQNASEHDAAHCNSGDGPGGQSMRA